MPWPVFSHLGAAHQAVGGLEADGPDACVADLLGHLGLHRVRLAVDGDVEGEHRVDLRHRVGRELDVDHRAGDGDDAAVLQRGLAVGHGHVSTPNQAGRSRWWWWPAMSATLRALSARRSVLPDWPAAQGLGAADDLHDLGGDRVLAGPVHDAAELGDELLGVVGGGLHGSLLGGEEGGRALEQGGVQAGLGVAGQEPVEDLARAGLELVVGARTGRLLGGLEDVGLDRHEALELHALHAGGDELRVADLHGVVLAVLEALHDGLGDLASVLVGRLVGEADEAVVDGEAAEAEVAGGLLADGDEAGLLALGLQAGHLALDGADDGGVVAAAEAAVAGDGDEGHGADLVALLEQGGALAGAGGGQVADHLGDLLAVGPRGVDPLLGLEDPAGGDELHRLGDLLGRLHRLDASAQDPLGTTGH